MVLFCWCSSLSHIFFSFLPNLFHLVRYHLSFSNHSTQKQYERVYVLCESSRAQAHFHGCNTWVYEQHSSIWKKKYGTHQFNCILDFNSFKQILMGSVLDSNALNFIYIFFSDFFFHFCLFLCIKLNLWIFFFSI